MELSLAVGRSIEGLGATTDRVIAADGSQACFWMDELLIEMESFEAATQLVLDDERVASPYLRRLLKSVNLEIHGILTLLRRLSDVKKTKSFLDAQVLTMRILARQKRLLIKGRYMVSHLKDYFTDTELNDLGDAFAEEQAAVSLAVHTMSLGG